MITSSKEVDSQRKKEGDTTSDGKVIKASSSSSTTPWLRLKDPRIVRVSRAFGGKDRHSKVCTIRGLRDRRVRLSVPTAIQLYDLQDRLGLNQPSKVVDWLLNAAKQEIDELPPLPMAPMNFSLNHEVGASQSNILEGFKLNSSSINLEDNNQGVLLTRPNFWNSDAFLKAKSKEIARDSMNEKENWTKTNEEEDNKQEESNEVPSSSTLFPRPTHSSSSSLAGGGFINNAMPYGSFFQLEHPNFPLSHLGNHGFAAQTTDHHHHHDLHNLNAMPLPSTLSLSSGSQILVCPPGTAQPYNFPSHEIDPRSQINHFQMLTSSTQNLFPNSLTTPSTTPYSMNQSARPFHFSVTPRLFHNSHSTGSHDQQPDNKDQ